MKIKGLIFDFDGTMATPSTLDFAQLNQTLATQLAPLGYLWPEQGYVLERLRAVQEQASLRLGQQAAAKLARDLTQHITQQEIQAAQCSQLLPFTAQVLEQATAQGLKIAIVSRNCAPAIISVFAQARNYVFLPRDITPWIKPDPRHFTYAARKMGLPAQACVAVGDHPMDMEGARASGCLPVGVLSGLGDAKSLGDSGAQHILENISQLLPWLREHNLLDNSPANSKF